MIHRAFGVVKNTSPVPVPAPPESLDLDACYRYCEAIARTRSNNFPVASRFMPSQIRKHILAIYAFARAADDFADEKEFAGRRGLELDRWEQNLELCFHEGSAEHPVFVALADTVQAFDLPITPFASLISAFRSDLETRSYPTYQDLRGYTALSSEPVAQLFLYLSGCRDPELHKYAAELASGLAIANFLQNVHSDLADGRTYIPLEDLRHFGLTESGLANAADNPRASDLFRFEVARARSIFERARPVVREIGDISVEIALMWHGGMRILDKIETQGARVLAEPPRLTALDKANVVSKSLAWRGTSLRGRAVRKMAQFLGGG